MTQCKELIDKAKEYLRIGKVDAIIGYAKASNPDKRKPIFIYSDKQADELTLDNKCEYNLAGYLIREDFINKHKKIAIFLNLSGIRTINVLSSEEQIDPSKIIILGFNITNENITILPGETIEEFDEILTELKNTPLAPAHTDEIKKLESMSAQQRFEYWREQFAKCIKCYACRQACPMCYCSRCITDCNQPQWICTSSHTLGNFEWNIVRAFHLAGRCVGCGNCESVCPVDIPLMLLNRRIASEIADRFDYFAGLTQNQQPVLASFKQDDPQEFIL